MYARRIAYARTYSVRPHGKIMQEIISVSNCVEIWDLKENMEIMHISNIFMSTFNGLAVKVQFIVTLTM